MVSCFVPKLYQSSSIIFSELWLSQEMSHGCVIWLRTSQFLKEIQTALDIHEPKRILKYGETLRPTCVSLGTLRGKSGYTYTAELQFSS